MEEQAPFWAPKGGAPKGGAPKGGAPKGGAPKGGAPKGGAPKGGAPKGWGSEGWGGAPKGGEPEISRFFFPSPATISLFLCLSGCLVVEFWWCFEGRNPEMCTFGVLGLSCEAPAAPKSVWPVHDDSTHASAWLKSH